MEANNKTRLFLRAQHTVFVVLLLAIIGLLAWLSTRYDYRADWTASGRNSLSPASIALLKRLHGPVTITAVARQQAPAALRPEISALVRRYQRHKPDISLHFLDPGSQPQEVRALGVRVEGEMVVGYQGRSEHIERPSEQALSNTLQRLLRGGQRRLVFTTGHGERAPHGAANFDYGQWIRVLKQKGFTAQTLNLARHPAIPADTSVLVIAGPQVDFLPGEVRLIRDYVQHGGNLLWLHDPGPLHGLAPLAEALGVKFVPGVIVDPTAQQLGIPRADYAIVTGYGDQAIVKGFRYITLFPQAAGLQVTPPKGWQQADFLRTAADSWAETGPLSGTIRFDAGQDTRGPLTLGVALTRTLTGPTTDTTHDAPANTVGKTNPKTGADKPTPHHQRVVVLGDGDFLSNAILGNQGNLDLGERLVNWLAHDDEVIDIPARTAPDIKLSLDRTTWALVGLVFLAVLPLFLLVTGVTVWARRRKR